MKIKKVHLQNFRCFKDEEIEFAEDFTVLVGKNASGKTTILEVLTIAMGGLLSGFDGVKSRDISPDEVRLEHYPRGSFIDSEPQYPLRVTCEAVIDDKEFIWTRALNKEGGRTTRNEASSIIEYAENLQKEIRQGNDKIILPLVSYYSTGRLWVSKKEKTEKVMAKINSRFTGYTDCLHFATNDTLMIRWFEKMSGIHFEEGKEPEELKAVKRALKYSLKNNLESGNQLTEDDVDILYSAKWDDLVAVYPGEDGKKERLPFGMLSDGYRNTLGMIADIAYRMAILNPQLLDRVIDETYGVVLIDEIDLHIHPKWQRNIVRDLKTIFPKVQFIVTTHSPNILTTVKKENVRIIQDRHVVKSTPYTYGRDINSVLFDLMGVEQRDAEVQKQIDEFYTLLENEDLENAEKKLNQLILVMGENDTEMVRAKTMLDLERF